MRVDSGHRVMERRTFLGMIAGGLLAAPLAAEARQREGDWATQRGREGKGLIVSTILLAETINVTCAQFRSAEDSDHEERQLYPASKTHGNRSRSQCVSQRLAALDPDRYYRRVRRRRHRMDDDTLDDPFFRRA
jgi:hypothetical protein